MILAIKRIHNLPPHFGYVSTLPDITQKLKHSIDELKQRLIDTWDCDPQGIFDEAIDQWQTRLHACVKAKGRHFEQCDLDTQLVLSEPVTRQTGSFQSHSHYWEEDNITFRFLCNVR